jgi:hypothetical protein
MPEESRHSVRECNWTEPSCCHAGWVGERRSICHRNGCGASMTSSNRSRLRRSFHLGGRIDTVIRLRDGRRDGTLLCPRSRRIAVLIKPVCAYGRVSYVTTRTVGVTAMVAIHAGTPHQPSRLRIGHISISFQRNRNAIGIGGKAARMKLHTSGTAVTRGRIDHASNENPRLQLGRPHEMCSQPCRTDCTRIDAEAGAGAGWSG